MKTIKGVLTRSLFIASLMAVIITLISASHIQAQMPPLPPAPTNLPPPLTPEQIATMQAALAAQQAALYQAEYQAWAVQDVPMSYNSFLTQEALDNWSSNSLLSLSASITADNAAQQSAVSNFMQATGFPQSWTDTNGNVFLIDRIDESGAAAIKTTFNTESANTVSADKLWIGGSSGFNLSGTNIKVGQWDGGDVLTNHQEFSPSGIRVRIMDGVSPYGVVDHATHVAGTIGAYGVIATAKGFSNRGTILESDFVNDLSEMASVTATNALHVSNHSYGISGGWWIWTPDGVNYYWVWNGDVTINTNQDWHFGFYDSYARTNDQVIYTAQNYLPVFSAGNERGGVEKGPASQPVGHYEYSNGVVVVSYATRPLDDANGGFHTLTSYSVSKNALVIGAVTNIVGGYAGSNSVGVAWFSSFGPTAEGRIKPDLCAGGVNVYSTFATNTSSYGYDSGTSMSAPAVTGTLGLVLDIYERLYGTSQPMLSSTLKGISLHTADECGTSAGPDYRFGWGLLNAQSAANLITNNYTSHSLAFTKEVRLLSGDYIQFPVVLTGGQPFKATIVWTDPPGTPTSSKLNPTNHMLVNDLDLRVVSPTGVTNYPWVLNPNSPANAATTGDNTVDNVEQVSIPNPTSGTYLMRVTHKGNLLNDLGQTSYQNVSVMLSGNTAQAPIVPNITSMAALTVSNTVALKWSSEVGRVYRIQYRDNIASGSWQYATSELSATKTNTAVTVSVAGLTNRFYRVAQIR